MDAPDEKLIKSFKSIIEYGSLCAFLGVSKKQLQFILFKKKKLGNQYREFKIPKKNGDYRIITSPCNELMIIQRKLNYVMNKIYHPHNTVYGFINGRGIKANAEKHKNKRYVLNFDLDNFFFSINLGRVRGILKSYFEFSNDVATIIANICCYNNKLPQGAPTSPLLSNMACYHLDKALEKLARNNYCVYTRYADDITISSNRENFPSTIAYISDGTTFLSEEIHKNVERNGFEINDKKTRLHDRYQNQTVTGITVNEKLNVKRNYIKKIRAILRCLETNEIKVAQQIFEKKYTKVHKSVCPQINDVVIGMINYVGYIKGHADDIFIKLANRYNTAVNKEVFKVQQHNLHWLSKKFVYVLETGDFEDGEFIPYDQGTGFLLKDVGLVTNYHVAEGYLTGSCNSMAVYLPNEQKLIIHDHDKLKIKCCSHKYKDIAVFPPPGINHGIGFTYCKNNYAEEKVCVIGFPKYGANDTPSFNHGNITQYKELNFGVESSDSQIRIITDARIVVGNSGGPVVNEANEVIGIASKGFKSITPNLGNDEDVLPNIVKIEDVLSLMDDKINSQ